MHFPIEFDSIFHSNVCWDFRQHARCNPHDNYVHITGYPVWHGVFLYLLCGKILQCTFIFFWRLLWSATTLATLMWVFRALRLLKISYQNLTMFFMSTWWGDWRNIQKNHDCFLRWSNLTGIWSRWTGPPHQLDIKNVVEFW